LRKRERREKAKDKIDTKIDKRTRDRHNRQYREKDIQKIDIWRYTLTDRQKYRHTIEHMNRQAAGWKLHTRTTMLLLIANMIVRKE
jgi:hypothetical protein